MYGLPLRCMGNVPKDRLKPFASMYPAYWWSPRLLALMNARAPIVGSRNHLTSNRIERQAACVPATTRYLREFANGYPSFLFEGERRVRPSLQ